VKRREFITLLGGAVAAWPIAARAQRTGMPVVGFLRGSTAAGSEHLVAGLRQGLDETGYVEGQSVAIEYRWADGHLERLPTLAADLVRLPVAVLVGSASTGATAAKNATSTIPIVFVTTVDPVKEGLVESLNRPGGNATGLAYLTSALGGKRLEYLRQLVPSATSVAELVHADNPATKPLLRDLSASAVALGVQIIVTSVKSEQELERAFEELALRRPGALIVGADPLLTSRSKQIVALAMRHKLPAIYTTADWARAGGLIAWGVSLVDQYRLAGIYVGKILKGAKPEDLPVLQPIKYELVINLKTAKELGLAMPPTLLALADEVIE
jgi:putative ABC transport system substrate-binding protein